MPALKDVVWVIEDNYTLNLCSREKGYTRGSGLPCEDSNPACPAISVVVGEERRGSLFTLHPGDERCKSRRREHRCPMILRPSDGTYRRHLRQRRRQSQCPCQCQDHPVNQGYWASIV